MKQTADHARRMLKGAKLEIAGRIIRLTFRDESWIELLVEEQEYKTDDPAHYEKAMRLAEWLRDNSFATRHEYRKIDERIVLIGGENIKQTAEKTCPKDLLSISKPDPDAI
jgi:hypothetical protein